MSDKAYLDPSIAAIVQPMIDARDERIAELEKKWAIVFDGYAVLNELTPSQRSTVSPEAVSAVLDSIARLAALEVKDAPEAPRIKTTWQADWERGKRSN